ncbi:hypothetical protein Pint_11427 [Pistacia integerrima]|uniref:Uncharacterized protein n=1 Tax=Pistacia integerrima TaxID=434235 RepID=A0ACC0XLG8_9ROSI|nr:hypothetical protein Pint_11427 [Pistacia integerrima]
MPAAPPNSLKNKPIIPLSQLPYTHFHYFSLLIFIPLHYHTSPL